MHGSSEALIQACGVIPRVWTGLVLNDNYKVGSLIEQGSTFELYDGTQISTNDRVCLKILLPQLAADPKTLALFLDEARIMRRISHPGLVQYRTCARDPQSDLSYIVMDFPGPRLSARLTLLKSEPEEILAFGKRLACALAAAHRAGLVHGHLSPESVVLPEEGLKGAAIIGFSLIKTEMSPAFDRAVVKVEYWAPEQTGAPDDANIVGPWTDIYSLALVILSALSGQHGCSDVSLLPRKLRPVLIKMLRANPRRRLSRMDDVVELLDGVVLDSRSVPRAIVSSLSDLGRLRLAKMSYAAGSAGRASFAAAALLTAASPWLFQSSVPQAPAEARAASVMNQVQLSAPIKASAQPAVSNSDASADHGLAFLPTVPLPRAKPAVLRTARIDRPGDTSVTTGNPRRPETADLADAARNEAEQTALLNAGQTRSVTGSTEQAAQENRKPDWDLAGEETALSNAADQAPVETWAVDPPAAAQQAISQLAAAEREAVYPPLLPSALPQLVDNVEPDAAPLVAKGAAPPAETPSQMTEQAVASRAAAARAKATEERKLREWCKVQRRRCTFPTQP